MDEQLLRQLVREAVERHVGRSTHVATAAAAPLSSHPSHARFQLLSGADLDGPCLIEPAVSCNHCGYCLSHGH